MGNEISDGIFMELPLGTPSDAPNMVNKPETATQPPPSVKIPTLKELIPIATRPNAFSNPGRRENTTLTQYALQHPQKTSIRLAEELDILFPPWTHNNAVHDTGLVLRWALQDITSPRPSSQSPEYEKRRQLEFYILKSLSDDLANPRLAKRTRKAIQAAVASTQLYEGALSLYGDSLENGDRALIPKLNPRAVDLYIEAQKISNDIGEIQQQIDDEYRTYKSDNLLRRMKNKRARQRLDNLHRERQEKIFVGREVLLELSMANTLENLLIQSGILSRDPTQTPSLQNY